MATRCLWQVIENNSTEGRQGRVLTHDTVHCSAPLTAAERGTERFSETLIGGTRSHLNGIHTRAHSHRRTLGNTRACRTH